MVIQINGLNLYQDNKRIINQVKQNIMSELEYNKKANEINAKYPKVNAVVKKSPWGGRLEIEVAKSDYAKALNEMFLGYNFTYQMYV